MQVIKNDNYLSKENCNCLKAIFALAIMISHMFAYRKFGLAIGLGPIITAFGYLSVSGFLFFSGYGLTVSYISRGNTYFDKYLRKRVLPVYIINIVLIILYSIFQIAIGYKLSAIQILQSFFNGGTVVKYGWYIQMIILLYILYLVAFKKSSLSKGITKLSILILLFCISFAILKMNHTWYESSFAFVFGAVWAAKKADIDEFLNKTSKHYFCVLLLSLLTFAASFILGNAGFLPLIVKIPIKMISTIAFISLVMLFAMKIKVNYKPIEFAGNYFFEVYILQGFFIILFNEVLIISSNVIYYIACILCSFVAATLIHPAINCLNKKVKGGY